MAAMDKCAVTSLEEQTMYFSLETSDNCVNCALIKQQLHSTLQELKSAQTIISLLQEDIKSASHASSTENQTQITGHDTSTQKWKTVLRYNSSNVNKKPSTPETVNKQRYTTTNRFAPLSNLEQKKHAEDDHVGKGDLPRTNHPLTSHSPTESIKQRSHGSRIPTIVNGRINHFDNKKPTQKLGTSKCKPKLLTTKHKVRLIGDSHIKGASTRINQYLNTKFQVSSIIKTGAGVSQLVNTQDNELKGLGKSDVVVINGGANDIDKPGCNVNALVAKMFKFALKYNNTNILMVTLPNRHDMKFTHKTQASIRAYNSKLKNISNAYNHVSVVDMSSNRYHYTKHGFHMNNWGKEWFAKQVASQIEKLTKLLNEPKSVIPLEWKEMHTTLHNNIPNNQDHTRTLTVSETPETLVPTILTHNPTANTISEPQLRWSTRTKMVPRTRSRDFLW